MLKSAELTDSSYSISGFNPILAGSPLLSYREPQSIHPTGSLATQFAIHAPAFYGGRLRSLIARHSDPEPYGGGGHLESVVIHHYIPDRIGAVTIG
jgi:hypothetical protein